MSLEIKPAGLELRDAVLAAAKETLRIHRVAAPEGSNSFQQSDLHQCLLDALNGSEKHLIFAAYGDGQFCGYALLSQLGEDSEMWLVSDIWVAPPERGKGIAPALLREAIGRQMAEGWPYLYATIADWNVASRGAFRHAGFLELREHGITNMDQPIHIMVHPGPGKKASRNKLEIWAVLLLCSLFLGAAILAFFTR